MGYRVLVTQRGKSLLTKRYFRTKSNAIKRIKVYKKENPKITHYKILKIGRK